MGSEMCIRDRPIVHLKEAANSGNGYHEVESVRAIFGLRDSETASPGSPGVPEDETG